LYEYGVDSLLALELKHWCAKVLASEVSVLELPGAEILGDLAAVAALRAKSSALVKIDEDEKI